VDEPVSRNLKVMEDKTIRFEITAYDLDADDDVSLEWFLDGVKRGEGTNHYTYAPGGYSVGKHTIEVVVTDGHGSASETWNVTVQSLESQRELVAGYTWDQWSVFIQIIVIIATAIIGFIGFRRLRKKRGVLQEYMASIEGPMKGWKEDPEQSEIDLIEVVNKVENDYDNGLIEDLHYFLLDRQIKENLKEMRQWKIDSSFDYLPSSVAHEVDKILEDGKITDNEYITFAEMIEHTEGMTAEQKTDIKGQMKIWRNMDRGWTEAKRSQMSEEGKKKGIIRGRKKPPQGSETEAETD
jgi:hypothetical protein